jgi:hypothetical protein
LGHGDWRWGEIQCSRVRGGALWHFWGTIVHFEVVIRFDRLQNKQCPVISQVTWIVLEIGRRYV